MLLLRNDSHKFRKVMKSVDLKRSNIYFINYITMIQTLEETEGVQEQKNTATPKKPSIQQW